MPSGTATFLCTDIVGSTQLWEQHPQAMPLDLLLTLKIYRRWNRGPVGAHNVPGRHDWIQTTPLGHATLSAGISRSSKTAMADTITPIRVFISSPGDLIPERSIVHALLDEINHSPVFRLPRHARNRPA